MTGLLRKLRGLSGGTHVIIAFIPVLLLALLGVPLAKVNFLTFEAAAVLAAVWGFAFSILWWDALDEASQEAHKFAWFWGGSVGLVVAGLVLMAIPAVRPLGDAIQHVSVSLPGWRPGPAGFLVGVLFTVLLLLGSYSVVWVGWWAATRKPR